MAGPRRRALPPRPITASKGGEPCITAIDTAPKDPNERVIRVGRRIAARLPSADVESLRLRVGRRWTPRLAERAAAAERLASAWRDAIRMLGRAATSSARLTEKLERRGYDAETARGVVDRLRAEGWLDDAAYADEVAERLGRRGPTSRNSLRAALRARGVDAFTSTDAAGRHASDDLDTVVAYAKRLAARGGTAAQRIRRIGAALSRRGVDDGTIASALERIGLRIDPDGY